MGKKAYGILIVDYDGNLLQILPVVKHLKKENPNVEIHFLTGKKMDNVTCQIKKYVSKIVQIREYTGVFRNSQIISYLNKFLFLFPFILLSYRRKYDIVNMHFVGPRLLKAMPWISKMSSNIVITPWGAGDVLGLDDNVIDRMQKIYSYASCVTTTPNSQMGEVIVEKFRFDRKKMHLLRFGMEYVDYLEDAKPNLTTEEAKSRFGIAGRYVITCGYSRRSDHQHEAVIDAVNSIKKDLPLNLTLLFPFTYGCGNSQYAQLIKDKCHEYGIDAVFVEDYLDLEGLYALRMATDLFVNVQKNDAGAGSVMQYFLCHKKIIHGSWLKYQYLQGLEPSFYFPIDTLEDLGKKIIEAYHSEKEIALPSEVENEIRGRGWNMVIKEWDSLFSSLVNE